MTQVEKPHAFGRKVERLGDQITHALENVVAPQHEGDGSLAKRLAAAVDDLRDRIDGAVGERVDVAELVRVWLDKANLPAELAKELRSALLQLVTDELRTTAQVVTPADLDAADPVSPEAGALPDLGEMLSDATADAVGLGTPDLAQPTSGSTAINEAGRSNAESTRISTPTERISTPPGVIGTQNVRIGKTPEPIGTEVARTGMTPEPIGALDRISQPAERISEPSLAPGRAGL